MLDGIIEFVKDEPVINSSMPFFIPHIKTVACWDINKNF